MEGLTKKDEWSDILIGDFGRTGMKIEKSLVKRGVSLALIPCECYDIDSLDVKS